MGFVKQKRPSLNPADGGTARGQFAKSAFDMGVATNDDTVEDAGAHHLVGARCRSVEDYQQYVKWLGARPQIVTQFLEKENSATTWSQNLRITEDIIETWKDIDVRHEWTMPLATVTEPMSETIAGKHDAVIEAHFRLLAKRDRHRIILIRLGWEANNPTAYPHSWSAPGSSAEAYIAAYRRVVDIARRVSKRFRFVWCILPATKNADNTAVVNPELGYPGDAYVDVISMDLYYDAMTELAGGTHIQRWVGAKLYVEYGVKWMVDFAAAHGKPIALSEWGLNADSGVYAAAVTRYFNTQNTFYTCYFDANAGTTGQFFDKISDDSKPSVTVSYRNLYGPLSIATPETFTAPTGSAFSTKLEANRRVQWSFAGDYGPFSITMKGSTAYLIAPAQAAGLRTVRLRATDLHGDTVEKDFLIRFVAGSTQPETQFYFSHATVPPPAAYVAYVDALVIGLKANDLWDAFDRFFIFQGTDQGLSEWDLLSIRNKGFYKGNVIYTPKGGFRSDGSTGYFDTDFEPSMPGVRFQQDDNHWGVWLLTNLPRTGGLEAHEFGSGTTVAMTRLVNGNAFGKASQAVGQTVAGVPFPGHVLMARDSATAWRGYRRGVPATTGTDASARMPYETLKVGGVRVDGGQFGGNDIAFAHFGRGIGMTDAKIAALHGLLNDFRNGVSSL